MTRGLRTSGPLMLPSAAVFLLVFVAPLSYFFVLSFWRVKSYKLVPDLSFANYSRVFDQYHEALLFTFSIALIISATVTLLAFGFAFVVRFKAGKYSNLLLFGVLITLFGGYLSKIYIWKIILGQSGILNSALLGMGFIDTPLDAFLYNPAAVVITLTHYMLPLAILPIYGSLRAIDDVPLRGARDLGASRWRVFWDIIVPQCQTGIMVGFTLSFLFSAGDYVTPKLVGGPYTSMIGVFIQVQFGLRFDAPLGAAMAFSVIAICLIIVGMTALMLRRALRVR